MPCKVARSPFLSMQNSDCRENNSRNIFDYINQVSALKQNIDTEIQNLLDLKKENERKIEQLTEELNEKNLKLDGVTKLFQELKDNFQNLSINFNAKCLKYQNLKKDLHFVQEEVNSVTSLFNALRENHQDSKNLHNTISQRLDLYWTDFNNHQLTLNEIDFNISKYKLETKTTIKNLRRHVIKLKNKLKKLKVKNKTVLLQFYYSNSIIEELTSNLTNLGYSKGILESQLKSVTTELSIEKDKNRLQSLYAQSLSLENNDLKHGFSFQELLSVKETNDFRQLLFCLSIYKANQEKKMDRMQCRIKSQEIQINLKNSLVNKCLDRIRMYKSKVMCDSFYVNETISSFQQMHHYLLLFVTREASITRKHELFFDLIGKVREISFDIIDIANCKKDIHLYIPIDPLYCEDSWMKNISELATFINSTLIQLGTATNKLVNKRTKIQDLKSYNKNYNVLYQEACDKLEKLEHENININRDLQESKIRIEQLNSQQKQMELITNERIEAKNKEIALRNNKLEDFTKGFIEFQSQSIENLRILNEKIAIQESKIKDLELENEELQTMNTKLQQNRKSTKRLLNVNDSIINLQPQISSTPAPNGKPFSVLNTPVSVIPLKKPSNRRKKSNTREGEGFDIFAFK